VSQTTSHRFLIVRLGALGDVIHGIPVAAALRERFPASRIDWMVDPTYVDLLRHVRGVDAPVPVDPRRQRASLLATLRQLRAVGYTAAVDLQGLIKSAVLARSVGAWRTIGFPRAHLREPLARLFYTETPDPGTHRHVVYKNLALLASIGIRQPRPAFPIEVPDTPVLDEARRAVGGHAYAVLNPGAGWPNKQWPAARFGALAAALRDRAGLRSLVLWGPGEEALAGEVVDASGGAAVRSPATGILDLFAIAKAARVMVSGDTGPLHVATAVGTPVVGLFGPTYADRNGPWSASDVTIARTEGCACLYRRRCRRGQPCIEEIGVDEVASAVGMRLESQGR
jgi:lipopolysaccharide heptosyltransferase I